MARAKGGNAPARQISVEGLDDFRRDLNRYAKDLGGGKALGKVNKEIAEFYSGKADDIGRGLGGVHAHVVRQKSIRARGAQKRSEIVLGGQGQKHGPAMGAEFGSNTYAQFPAHRGSGSGAGYMLYPAIRENADEGAEMYWDAVEDLAARAFPNKR